MTLNSMLKRCAGLQGTGGLTDWEERFIANLLALTRDGDDTRPLTEGQCDRLEQLFKQHYGDA